MKKGHYFFLIFLFFLKVNCHSQTYIKANSVLLPVGVLNFGIEQNIKNHFTFQADFLISPWKSFFDNHLQIYSGTIEGRYYFKESFKNWYIGGNLGMAVFDIQKWNYWDTNKYQRGFTFLGGVTVGYQYQWKENWNLDFFLGGGTSQGFYHGYENNPPKFFRYEGSEPWNRSGELIPFRGGIMVSYKLK